MIYITGDTHGELDMKKLSTKNWLIGAKLKKTDYLIITGDFGLLWSNNEDANERYWKTWLDMKSWTTLFVDGNHENHPRLNQLETVNMFGNDVGKITDNIFHLRRGKIYTIENQTFFTFGGASSHDKLYRTEGLSWWPEEVASYEQMEHGLTNLENINNEVDYIITHTAPITLIQMIGLDPWYNDAITKYLEHLMSIVKYKKWYCGHFHIDKQIHKFRALYHDIIEAGK